MSNEATVYLSSERSILRRQDDGTSAAAMPSSIGAIGKLAYDPNNDRVRGFFPEPVDVKAAMAEAEALAAEHCASRVTLRFVVRENELPIIHDYEEARIPIGNGEFIVYCAKKTDGRMTFDIESRRTQDQLVIDGISSGARWRGRVPFLRAKLENEGYEFSVFRYGDALSERDISDLVNLYLRTFDGTYCFPINRESVQRFITSSDNIVAIARQSETGQIVACYVGEMSEIRPGFLIAEMSEAATLHEHRQNGLNTVLAHLLASELFQLGVDVVYAETRANSKGSTAAMFRIGGVYVGRLTQAVRMPEDRLAEISVPFESLNVMHLPRDRFFGYVGVGFFNPPWSYRPDHPHIPPPPVFPYEHV